MAKTSVNLSERVFFTIDHNDDTAYIGELAGTQKRLVTLTADEFRTLAEFLYYNVKDYV